MQNVSIKLLNGSLCILQYLTVPKSAKILFVPKLACMINYNSVINPRMHIQRENEL